MNSPILIITYNRPKEFSKFFKILKNIKNRKLYIFQDGQKNKTDKHWVKQNNLLKQIEKKKNIILNVCSKNYGCKLGVKKSIDWFFSKNKEGIILEDDCLPSKSFFRFCDEMLKLYRSKKNIKTISGYNFYNNFTGKESYFFTKHVEVWGWASWRRVWKKFNLSSSDWKKKGKQILSRRFKNNENLKNYYLSKFSSTFKNKIDTWDHQFVFYIWKTKGLTISPKINLVKNIGFNIKATHTKKKHKKLELKSNNLRYPLIHPRNIKEDKEMTNKMDIYLEKEIYFFERHANNLKKNIFEISNKLKKLIYNA